MVFLCDLIIVLPTLHILDVLFEPLADSDGLFQVVVTELSLAEARQLSGRGDGVADLPTVHGLPSQIVQMRSHIVEIDVLFQVCQTVDELAPDFGALVAGEVVVV